MWWNSLIMIPVLLSGGSGTRLWPVSRAQLPKQFCDFLDESLQTLSLRRVSALGTPMIVTSSALRVLTEKNLKDGGFRGVEVLYEPVARNTAPALALLCRSLQLSGRGGEVVAVFPSDHLIKNEPAFLAAVRAAEKEALRGSVVTIGITPTRPETGFGYIQLREGGSEARAVERFFEKPALAQAQEFLRAGSFVWNAGIFVFKADVMASLLEKHEPDVWKAFVGLKSDLSNLGEVYSAAKSISIDYAVMEKIGGTGLLLCVPADMGWSDVGSWDAIVEEQRAKGVTSRGTAVTSVDSSNVYVEGPAGKRVALIGVSDLTIVDTRDALLVVRAGESQKVKGLVDQWVKSGDSVAVEHVYSDRPWGRYEILRDTDKFKSKVIHVDPGQQISYQSHAKREEHWIVTDGAGEVVLNDEIIPVRGGTYVHIPLGAKHRIRNTGAKRLEFVEVQVGTYFGEDDIVRYQDDYQRK